MFASPFVAAVIALAVVKWRVSALEKCHARITRLIDKLFERTEKQALENAQEHKDFAVAIASIKSTQETAEVIADALLDFLRKQGHDTERYSRRRNGGSNAPR